MCLLQSRYHLNKAIGFYVVAIIFLWFDGQKWWSVALVVIPAIIYLFLVYAFWEDTPSKSPLKSGKKHIPGFDDSFKPITPIKLQFRYDGSDGITRRKVEVWKRREFSYLKGWCNTRNAERTFKIDNIIGNITDTETGEIFTKSQLKDRLRADAGYSSHHTLAQPQGEEICFTGFKKQIKSELEELATANDFFIRTKVTKNLDYLCKGPGKAPSKVAEAKANGATVISEDEFRSMCE